MRKRRNVRFQQCQKDYERILEACKILTHRYLTIMNFAKFYSLESGTSVYYFHSTLP
jgi:hypothetical protein